MSDRLYGTGKELRKALEVDIRDFKSLKKQDQDTKGIEQVIKHKTKMLRDGSWR